MDVERRNLEAAVGLARVISDAIEPTQFEQPTACEAWTVGDILNAIVVKADIFATAVTEPVQMKPDPWPQALGDDHRADVRRALDRLRNAYETGDPSAQLTPPPRGRAAADSVLGCDARPLPPCV